MNQPLRFGIVGCGGIAGLHARCFQILASDGDALLVAGAETDAGRRESFGAKWSLPMHDSLESMLARDDLDAVVVTSPSGLHATHAIQALKSGRHTLSEKPLDTNAQRAQEAIAVAKDAGVTLGGIFQQRFNTGVEQVKRAVAAGELGEIDHVHCETPWYRSQGYYDSGAWRGTWDLDGGVLSNQGVHMIDRLIWLAGDWDEVLSAVCESKGRSIEAETVAAATIRLKGGAIATITGTTLAYDGLPQRVMVCGTDGCALFVNDDLAHFKTRASSAPASSDLPADADFKASDPLALSGNQHVDNIRDFVDAIRNNREPKVTAESCLRVVALLNAIYQAAGVGPYAA